MTRVAAKLLGLLVTLAPLIARAETPPDYGGYRGETMLRFLDPPQGDTQGRTPAGTGIETIPRLRLSFGGVSRPAVMDTGSTGIVVSAAAIPDFERLPSQGPAQLTYSSSGRIEIGVWVTVQATIAGADGAFITTAPLPVIAVTRIACLRTARNCTPEERPDHVAMIGVGFGREYDHQDEATPDKNPLLNVVERPGEPLRRGYVVTSQGVHVGLTGADTAGNFAFVKLGRDPTWPDWSGAPACITVGAAQPACGRSLFDTGVAGMFLTVPPDRLAGNRLPPGTHLAVSFGPAGYAFDLGDAANPLAPASVTLSGIGTRPPFVNTGFHLLNGFDFLFDADAGWVGYRRKE